MHNFIYTRIHVAASAKNCEKVLMGEIAALGTALCWSFGSMCFTVSSRLLGHNTVNRVRLVIALTLLLITHYVLTGRIIPAGITNYNLLWFGLSGIIGFAIGDRLLFRSFVLIGPRLGMLMMALAPVFGVIIAWIFLKEHLALVDIIAIAITLFGICWVVLEGKHFQGQKHHLSGILCGIGAAFGQALGLILSKKGLANGLSPLIGNIIRLFIASIFVWSLAFIETKISPTFKGIKNKKAFITLMGGSILGPFIGVWLSLVAVKYTYVGIASTLMALPPILLIPLSHFFFKEKINIRSIIGTIIAVTGVALIFLF